MTGDSIRKSIRDYENMRESERTFTQSEVDQIKADARREALEDLLRNLKLHLVTATHCRGAIADVVMIVEEFAGRQPRPAKEEK